ncbi:MAG: helix-turn-helix domain-containing protein, partial [Chloroflexota bacterium]
DLGWRVPRIAQALGAHEQTVRTYLKAFLAQGFAGLADRPRVSAADLAALGQLLDAAPAQALAAVIAVTDAEPLAEVSGEGRCAKTPLLPAPANRPVQAPGCLAVAARSGIDVSGTPCFLCFGVLNERQRRLSRDDPARSVPVLHLAQLLGMACGAAPVDLELGRITAPARPILAPFVL